MKNNIFIAIIASFSFLLSCNNDATFELTEDEQSNYINSKLKERYGFEGITSQIPDIAAIQARTLLKDKSENNLSGECYNFVDSNYKLYAIKTDLSGQNYLVFESSMNDQEEEIVRFLFEIENSLYLDSGGEIKIFYEDGRTIIYRPENVKLSYHKTISLFKPKVAYAKFCQREGGEGTKDCFDREADEFQSDFVSIVAWYTNPQIAILVAAMCTC